MKRDFFRAHIVKGHEEQGRTNPLFPVKKKPLWKKLLLTGALVALPVGVVAGSVSILKQPQFQITTVNIQGLESLDEQKVRSVIDAELHRRAVLFFTHGQQLFFNSDDLTKRLTSSLPLREATVVRNGGTIEVTVVEDTVMVLVRSADHWILIGLDGKILRELSAEEVSHLDDAEAVAAINKVPRILLDEQIDPELSEAVVPPERLAALTVLDHNLRMRGLTPASYTLSTRKTSWVKIRTQEKKYAVYVDLDQSIENQTTMLDATLTAYEGEDGGLQYIDLRFGKHVYVK